MNENDVILSKRDAEEEIRYILNRLNAALEVSCPPEFVVRRRMRTEVEEAREAVKRLQAMIREGEAER